MSRADRSRVPFARAFCLGTGLALALAPAGCRRGSEPSEAGSDESRAEDEAQGVAGRLFAKALALEASDPAAATEIYVRLTLDHANDPECGEGASGGRCASEARARIDVLACRNARAGGDPSAASVEALAQQLRAAAADTDPARLEALAACDFWVGACASDSGGADAPANLLPSLRERLRASDGFEVVEASEEAARLATKPDAKGRILELTLTHGEVGWSWDAVCESEPPPDTEP